MKLLLLSDLNSVHTIKWAISLAKKGVNIFLFGIGEINVDSYKGIPNIQTQSLDESITRNEGSLSKLKYIKAIPAIKRIIKDFQPDIMHAHYASSYGFIGALVGFKPFIVSVWGADVFNFPRISLLHKMLLKYNLSRANIVLSTSEVMAREARMYTRNIVIVTPFGIDLKTFYPNLQKSEFEKSDIVIGTVKTLEEKYGIEYLIRAFKIVSDRHSNLPLKLLIVGGGSLRDSLEKLAVELGVVEKTVFTGPVPYKEIPEYHNMLSISVSVSISNSESFGVAIIEASACEKPVVVSNVGGLPEVVEDGVTGFVVPPKDPQKTAEAIEKLVLDSELRKTIGGNGRKRVISKYNWENNVEQMMEIYNNTLKDG